VAEEVPYGELASSVTLKRLLEDVWNVSRRPKALLLRREIERFRYNPFQ
jgi:hypothetical protein